MITIWHNPRCSKSRQTLALIENSGASVTVRRYLDDSPTEPEIKAALSLLGVSAAELFRSGEKIAKELKLTRTTDAEILIAAMAKHPILIERPVVISGKDALIGRPPETVLRLL